MKNSIVALLFLSFTVVSLGQETETFHVLQADSTWKREVLTFPLGFAPELKYKGFEDILFSEGWSKQDQTDFWTYAFVWHIELNTELMEHELESSIETYFDGLMKAVNKDKDFEVPKTTALFVQVKEVQGTSRHLGKVKVYDSFFTQKVMTLNVMVEHYYCERTGSFIPFFKLSPKPFGDEVWKKLQTVVLTPQTCSP
ncbi:MAG: hypothetical protein AAFP76_10675 [Bacteroidota bacterium]